MQAIATDVVKQHGLSLCVSVFVCLSLEHKSEPYKNCLTDRHAVWVQTCVGPQNHVLDEVHIDATWRIRWNDMCHGSDTGCRYQYCSNLLNFAFVGFVHVANCR